MSDEVQRHPVDYEALTKGQIIPVGEVERIVRRPRTDPDFQLKALGLLGKIRMGLVRLQRFWSVRLTRAGIEVCDDTTALRYNGRQQRIGLRKHRRYHRNDLGIEPGKLATDEERVALGRRIEVEGKIIAACAAIRRPPPELGVAQRKTPLLPGPMDK